MIVEQNGEQMLIEADALIAAFGSKPYIPFRIENVPNFIIGDASGVRNIYSAVNEGFEVAIKI